MTTPMPGQCAQNPAIDAEIRLVTIPARQNHEGLLTITVKLHWTCPECGKPRGEVYRTQSYDGSLSLNCDGWKNPCGHVDHYSHVRLEAIANGLNETGENPAATHAQAAPFIQATSNYAEAPKRVSLSEIIQQQAQERGLAPMPLETELLIKRIEQGGHSGRFLADAFLSAYRKTQPFNHSLCELVNLDAEAFRLFHECLHIRHVNGWNDAALYTIEQHVKTILEGRA